MPYFCPRVYWLNSRFGIDYFRNVTERPSNFKACGEVARCTTSPHADFEFTLRHNTSLLQPRFHLLLRQVLLNVGRLLGLIGAA